MKAQDPTVDFNLFKQWMTKFAPESDVVKSFMKLGETCGLKVMDPQQDGPTLDAGDPGPLPDGMSSAKLIEIYSKLWDLQTEKGLQIKRNEPALPLSDVHSRLEGEFETQRV